MISEKELEEIKGHLERAQNPVFFFDNDCDGFCSFILLRKALGRGYGVVVKSYPELDKDYARKIRELEGDYIFVLDKPGVSEEFVKEADELGLNVVIIDHHEDSLGNLYLGENVFVYNSAKNCDIGEPTSYICYKLFERKEDMWIAMAGCIADHYLPEFSSEFGKKYDGLWEKKIKEPFDALYGTEIGKIALAINFGLKDSISNVVQMQKFFSRLKNAYEVFGEGADGKSFRERYEKIRKKYNALVEKAETEAGRDILFFVYSGDVSMSGDLANELSHRHKGKYIVIVRKNQGICNLSMRGKNILEIFKKIQSKIEGIEGGGHKDAIGGRMSSDRLEEFKKMFEEEVERVKNKKGFNK
jgi:single-stranded DNA-specific DHH superfamily exonuclease